MHWVNTNWQKKQKKDCLGGAGEQFSLNAFWPLSQCSIKDDLLLLGQLTSLNNVNCLLLFTQQKLAQEPIFESLPLNNGLLNYTEKEKEKRCYLKTLMYADNTEQHRRDKY